MVLGHVISYRGIEVDKAKVEAIERLDLENGSFSSSMGRVMFGLGHVRVE